MTLRRALALLLLALFPGLTLAAKVTVEVTTATQYTAAPDQYPAMSCPGVPSTTSTSASTALIAISLVCVTWGPCAAGAASGGPPTEQLSVQSESIVRPAGAEAIPGATVAVSVFPVGLSPVCFVAYNADQAGTLSRPTNVLVYTPPATPAQPVTLGQPVILSFNLSARSRAIRK